jgi:hypothetical protein
MSAKNELRLCFAFDDPGGVHLALRHADSDLEVTLCGRRAMPGELTRRAVTCPACGTPSEDT